MRTKLLTASLIVLCLVGVIAFFHSEGSAAQASLNSPTASGPGMSAIKPTLTTGVQRFTVEDVKAYIKAHPAPPKMTLASGAISTIVASDFITSKEASQRMKGEWVGLPDNALVCYVELHGPFLLNNVSRPYSSKPFAPSDTAVEVFDAQSGNLLVAGIP